MPATVRTPGVLYVVVQVGQDLRWKVVPVDEDQGRAMRRRGNRMVYDTSAQAYAVKNSVSCYFCNPEGH